MSERRHAEEDSIIPKLTPEQVKAIRWPSGDPNYFCILWDSAKDKVGFLDRAIRYALRDLMPED